MSSLRLFCRHFCDNASHRRPPSGDNYVKPISRLKTFMSKQLMKFIESYEKILEKRFPKTFKIYRVFTIGTKDFYNDSIEYIRISRELLGGKEVHEFNYNELIVYKYMPKYMARVGPVLMVTVLPFTNYLIFPLAYWFPKYLLSPHFWTLEQKQLFQAQDLKKRLYYYRPVFRNLQQKLQTVTTDDGLQEKFRSVFAQLGSGTHPSFEDIIDLNQSFFGKPYGIHNLKSRHLTNLCRMHGLSAFPLGKKSRLLNHIGFVRELDLAIDRTGIQSLNLDQIKRACFMRGLNPIELSKEEMITWLELWIKVAHKIDTKSLSLLLHCPIFLAYNNPSNWRQIH
ncbi:LETM1 domain-containing protein 1-like [Oppia nitens]|uniref:LETM1 domain-containing protein 1-like n=1 Tax=Oppia nitens TaxID=1686743 RepID=UPI0023DA4299|nr:LETM1 domain-containing protein 1-like [Oppia nitens]